MTAKIVRSIIAIFCDAFLNNGQQISDNHALARAI
jgi:hypothetical protein